MAATSEETGRQDWRTNFSAILICQLVIFVMFHSVLPFFPLYLRDLGEDEAGAVIWAGALQFAASAILLFVTPLWGAVADRVGRKTMVARAMMASGIGFILMSFASHAWQLFALRAFQGATAGTTSAIVALAASVLPATRLGVGMGVLQTSQFLGTSIGPLVGGLLTSNFGFRGTLLISGGFQLAISALVFMVVREPPRRAASVTADGNASIKARLMMVARSPKLRAPALASLAFQTGYSAGVTLLPLHLTSVLSRAGTTVTPEAASASVGLVLTSTALGVAAGATALGWLGGRIGNARVVAFGSLLAAGLLTLPQFVLAEMWQFTALRFFLGFAAGGVLPSLRAVLGEEAAKDEQTSGNLGAVYGVAQSAISGGFALGPLIASGVATIWGLPATHIGSGLVLVGAGLWWIRTQKA